MNFGNLSAIHHYIDSQRAHIRGSFHNEQFDNNNTINDDLLLVITCHIIQALIVFTIKSKCSLSYCYCEIIQATRLQTYIGSSSISYTHKPM